MHSSPFDAFPLFRCRIPEFKSFEELELPKHSKVKRQTSTPNASDLEQQPEINVEEWFNKSTFEILQKFNVSLTFLSVNDYEFNVCNLT